MSRVCIYRGVVEIMEKVVKLPGHLLQWFTCYSYIHVLLSLQNYALCKNQNYNFFASPRQHKLSCLNEIRTIRSTYNIKRNIRIAMS
jgi:hypothetical protein